MVVDFVIVDYRSNDVSTNMALAVELLQSSPYSAVTLFDEFGLGRFRLDVHFILVCFDIRPPLDFYETSSIVNFVCDVRRLDVDISDLTNECNLQNNVSEIAQ
jgi:hypothetical protein